MEFRYAQFFNPETILRPQELLAHARQNDPVFKTTEPKGRTVYVATTYPLVREILSNPQTFSSDFHALMSEGTSNAEADNILKQSPFVYSHVRSLLLNADGEIHKRLKRVTMPLFSPTQVTAFNGQIEALVHKLIDGFVETGECDLVNELALPFALGVILDVAGFDQAMLPKVLAWSDAAVARTGHMAEPAEEIRAAHLLVEMMNFLLNRVQTSRSGETPDLLHRFLQSEVGDRSVSDEEGVAFLNEILVAGNETSRSTLVAAMVLLLEHPEQLAKLRNDPALILNAIEEVLRYHSPGAATWRIAEEDVTLGGVQIPKGSYLMPRIDSANRDEAQFANPNAFDITRGNAKSHLAFGYAAHHCLGQFLARKEMVLAIPIILDRLAKLELIRERTDLSRAPHVLLHALKAVHCRFQPGTRAEQR